MIGRAMPYSPNDAAWSHTVGLLRSRPCMPFTTLSTAQRWPRTKRFILAVLSSDTKVDTPSATHLAKRIAKSYICSIRCLRGKLMWLMTESAAMCLLHYNRQNYDLFLIYSSYVSPLLLIFLNNCNSFKNIFAKK